MAYVKLGQKAEGSIVKIKENGTLVDFYVAKQNYEPGLNGAGRVLVARKDFYAQIQWNSSNVNTYASSTVDSWLNSTYKNLLDANIRTAMGTTRIYYTPGNGNTSKTTLERSVFLLSATELGRNHSFLNQEGTALSSTMVNQLNSSTYVQWTRSPYIGDTIRAWDLTIGGALYSGGCSESRWVRPTFTLPSTFYVRDDGTITANTPPTTPAAVTIPETIHGGKSVTVSWTASTDAQGNLEGYTVERSTDGGSAWTQVYQGGGLSATNTVPFGTESVMYRVRAYDSEGLYSSYRNSAQVTVINNTAPTAPGSITVPETVLGGGSVEISWTASADGENNLAGYALERQVDGGAWTEIFRGDALSFTDAITKGWLSVVYRVRAYDSENAYSGYTASGARTVDNNTPPAITCALPSGSDLGVKDEGFAVAYSVSDEEGDAITVTESIDGMVLRYFSAVDGAAINFQLNGLTFVKVLNGKHTLTITARDDKASTVHNLTFTKSVTAASVTLAQPMTADAPISVCVLSVTGSIPADAQYSVKVTNNALDGEPVWEDCTTAVKTGANHIFTNQTAANGFAFNFKVEVERGASGVGGYISSIQGGFQ